MTTTQSDMRCEDNQSHKTTVREFLRKNGEVASKDEIRAGTDVPTWYIDQITSTDEFYTSINHNGAYVASKYIIGKRGRLDFLWRPDVDDGIAVFHREESTKATLKKLAFRRPSGLTAAEENELLDRRCYRPLRQLAEDGEVHAADHNGTTVYTHSWPSLRDDQLSQRQTD